MVRTEVAGQLKDPRLSLFPVYLPMMPSDNKSTAESAAKKFGNEKISSFWDPKKDVCKEYAKVVKLPRRLNVAWDVYFLYGPDARWDDKPPAPIYWMHQLADDDKRLDGEKLRTETKRALEGLG